MVDHSATDATLICSNATDSQTNACEGGYYLVNGMADACIGCVAVTNSAAGATFTCSSATDSQTTGCASEFFLTQGALGGAADTCTEMTCTEIDSSGTDALCGAHATCSEGGIGYTCTCDGGFHGSVISNREATCRDCPDDQYSSTTDDETLCQTCPAGNQANEGRTGCESCALVENTISVAGEACFECAAFRTPNALRTDCLCSTGYYDASYYGTLTCFVEGWTENTAVIVADECVPCPVNTDGDRCATCAGAASAPVLRDGYRVLASASDEIPSNVPSNLTDSDHHAQDHTDIFLCAVSTSEESKQRAISRCPGVSSAMPSNCSVHYTGVLCQSCYHDSANPSLSYHKDSDGACQSCEGQQAQNVGLLVAIAIGVLIAMCGRQRLQRRQRVGLTDGPHEISDNPLSEDAVFETELPPTLMRRTLKARAIHVARWWQMTLLVSFRSSFQPIRIIITCELLLCSHYFAAAVYTYM